MVHDTPFDDLAVTLLERSIRLRGRRDHKLIRSLTFVQVCRIKYLQMKKISQRFWKVREAVTRQGTSVGTITYQDMLRQRSEAVEAKINYFGFIEELNRFGRVFEKKYDSVLPDYYRIRFYRDKVVEHWDDYEEFLQSLGDSINWTQGKLVIPYHMGAINTPPTTQVVYQELSAAFQKSGITLPNLDLSMMNEGYSEEVFLNLERIDTKLRRISKDIVNTLFKYCFPTPIHDLEQYSQKLLSWLGVFLGGSPMNRITDRQSSLRIPK